MTLNHPYPFFTQDDFTFFIKLKESKVKVSNINKSDKERLKMLFERVTYWANQVCGDQLIVGSDRRWQNSGSIKKYSWARIFEQRDKDKLIYFTVSFEYPGKLVYKLDCQRSQTMSKHLSPSQVSKLDYFLLGKGVSWNEILYESLPNYDWNTLINITQNFIKENLPLYRETIDYVWNESKDLIVESTGEIQFTEQPDIPKKYKKIKPYFKFKNIPEKIDFEKQHRASQRLGGLGEKFILDWEIRQLKKLKIDKLPVKVRDGEGYDIKSYDENGEVKFIEVKTTYGSQSTPFYISSNEVEFLKTTPNSFIYRLYNFKPQEDKGDIFIMTYQDLIKRNLLPKEYKVYFK